MPDVHFVGELESAALTDCPQISVTFAIIPGNGGWLLKAGHSHGETQTSVISLQDWSYLNHPLDAHYESSSAEGWPFLVCEVCWRNFATNERTIVLFIFLTQYFFCMIRYGINQMKEFVVLWAVVVYGCHKLVHTVLNYHCGNHDLAVLMPLPVQYPLWFHFVCPLSCTLISIKLCCFFTMSLLVRNVSSNLS